MRQFSLSASLTSLLLVAGVTAHCPPAFANDASADAIVRSHVTEQGAWQAIAIRDNMPVQNTVSRHIFLVDTSASQVGFVRDSGMELVKDLARQLPATDKLQLVAMDISSQSLTRGFVTPASVEFSKAVKRLEARTPLGATNLKAALESIIKLAGDKSTSVLWVGDGISAIHALQAEEVAKLSNRLSDAHMTLHAVVLGPKTNTDLPAVLTNLTGGTVHSRPQDSEATDVIAASLRAVGTEIVKLSVNGTSVTPENHVSYLRPDRHSMIFAEAAVGNVNTIEAVLADNRIVRWDSVAMEQGGAEVRELTRLTQKSGGIMTAVASLQMLRKATVDFHMYVEKSAAVARRLQRLGHQHQAERIANRAAELDSGNAKVATVLTALRASDPFQDDSADDAFTAEDASNDALNEVEAMIQVRTQKLQQATTTMIDEANSYAAEQPVYAESLLKDLFESIQSASEVAPEARNELERRVTNAIAAVQNRRDQAAAIQQENAVKRAVEESQEYLLAQQQTLERELQTIIDQVRGLLDSARHGDIYAYEDAEAAARVAIAKKPGNGAATQALMVSEAAGQLDKARRLRELRADRFLETLYQVELSHVPFPDEPPVQYPPADVWRALTLTRKPRYQAFSLQNESEVEGWLNRMLDEPIPELDYRGESSLGEILDFLADHYTETWGSLGGSAGSDFRMTIWPDERVLDLEGITSLDEVIVSDISLEGVPLRTALKLIFDKTDEPPLTYVIQDDVMLITTEDEATSDRALVTRVYPVGDLVIPPIPPQGGGGGGLGGGGVGGAGGVGGGGVGGVGGGNFSVPPEWDVLLDAGKQGITGARLKKRSRR